MPLLVTTPWSGARTRVFTGLTWPMALAGHPAGPGSDDGLHHTTCAPPPPRGSSTASMPQVLERCVSQLVARGHACYHGALDMELSSLPFFSRAAHGRRLVVTKLSGRGIVRTPKRAYHVKG